MRDPGAFVALDDRCRNETFLWLMRCSIGQGRVLLVADADLMADRLWATPTRIADNGPLLGAWLDGLAGISRDRHADSIRWIDPAAPRGLALIPAFLPGLLALGIGAILHRRRR